METKTLLFEICNFNLQCPSCSSTQYKKNGTENHNQRYKCKKCGRNFRSTTNTTAHQLHKKDTIETYTQCMLKSMSLRKTAQICGISLTTAFRWRHRFLDRIKATNQNKKLNCISAISLPYSHKGQRTKKPAHAKDSTSILYTGMTGINVHTVPTTANSKLGILHENNIRYFTPSTQLPTITKQSLTPAEKQMASNSQKQEEAVLQWLNISRGVATKYLQHYWQWFSQLESIRVSASHNTQIMYKFLTVTP